MPRLPSTLLALALASAFAAPLWAQQVTTSHGVRTLTRTDGWQRTWSDLPRYNPDGSEIVWTVTERPVPGYTANVQQSGSTFILTNTLDRQKLQQTGLLWWPVPVLAAAGLLLLIFGALSKRKNGHE